jgi:serine/threonine-protein kinase
VKGKLAYMAPEQITVGVVDRRADVFAAAIVLWEALTEKALFAHEGPARTLDAVLRDPIAPPSELAGSPVELDAVVLRGLERDAERRFATAREMAEAIEAATPIASRREVAEALSSRLGEVLEARRLLVRETEAASRAPLRLGAPAKSNAADPDATRPDATAEPPDGSTAEVAVALNLQPKRFGPHAAIAGLVVVLGLAALFAARSSLRAEATAPSSLPSVSVVATVEAPPPIPSAPSAEPRASATAAPSVEPRRTEKRARPAANCRDPFKRDDGGILLPRPECFR